MEAEQCRKRGVTDKDCSKQSTFPKYSVSLVAYVPVERRVIQNVAEPKVQLVLISTSTYKNLIVFTKLPIASTVLYTYST